MTKDIKLLTVSVVTQPHCQLHPPPLLMTLHASVVRNREDAQSDDQSITTGIERGMSRHPAQRRTCLRVIAALYRMAEGVRC